MTTPKHTPEPWAVVSYQFPEQQYREALIIAPDPTGELKNGLVVATVHWRGNQSESDANAALIRLSPRMARFLKRLREAHVVPDLKVADSELWTECHALLEELKKAGAL